MASAYVARGAALVPRPSEAAASQFSQRRNERVAAAEAERQQLVLDVAALEEACGVEPTLELAAFKSTLESYTMVDGRNGRNGLGLAFSRLELAPYDASLELAAGGINIDLAAPGTRASSRTCERVHRPAPPPCRHRVARSSADCTKTTIQHRQNSI